MQHESIIQCTWMCRQLERLPRVLQNGGYGRGLESDAVMLPLSPHHIERGVELTLTQVVQPQGKFDVRTDVQVGLYFCNKLCK